MSKQGKTLLVADNKADYRRSLRNFLELTDHCVVEAMSPEEALDRLEDSEIDLVLADLRLMNDADESDISGLKVARRAAEKGVPCIVITSFPSVDTARLALRTVGAEPLAVDYVIKAGGPQAVLDAIEAAFRRKSEEPRGAADGLVVDLEQRLASYKGQRLVLSRNQYALLAHLRQNAGVVCAPEELLKAVYGEEVPADQASADKRLERLVERLREKIEDEPQHPRRLIKEPRRGYRLVLNP